MGRVIPSSERQHNLSLIHMQVDFGKFFKSCDRRQPLSHFVSK
jgi:hypothetical protein